MKASIRAKFEEFDRDGVPAYTAGAVESCTKAAQSRRRGFAGIQDLGEFIVRSKCQSVDGKYVYFMRRQDGHIKIGYTKDPQRRIQGIRTALRSSGQPGGAAILALVHGGRAVEKYLHDAFRDDHVGGEWFRPSSSIYALIYEIAIAMMDMGPEWRLSASSVINFVALNEFLAAPQC